jgi:hypothetical protein
MSRQVCCSIASAPRAAARPSQNVAAALRRDVSLTPKTKTAESFDPSEAEAHFAARFRNELEDYMSEDYADETLKTIVSWGRYAELFAYDEQSELFSLENPY